MGFFSRLFRLGSASANEMLEKLESGKEVELTKGDLVALKKDEAKVLEALAEIKASIVSLQRDIKAGQNRMESYENNAMALLSKDPEDKNNLAQQNAMEAEREEENIKLLNQQLIEQTKLEMETRENLRTIQEAARSADNDLRLMKSMVAAKKSAEKARTGMQGLGKSSALERIQERKKKISFDLEKSRAMSEISKEGGTDQLTAATKAALGSTGGSNKLEQLKKRMITKG